MGNRDAADLTVTIAPCPDAFRESMARLAAAVHIVTAQSQGLRHGMTMTAACSLSVDPMSMILSIHRGSTTHDAILASRQLCLNMLAPGADGLAARFSGALGHHGEDRFAEGDWLCTPDAPPLLHSAAAALQCDLVEAHGFGTHSVLLCAVREVHLGPGATALVYANRRYGEVRHTAWKQGNDMQPDRIALETAPAFYKIFVADLGRSINFYSQCLGFREQRRIDAGKFDEVVLAPRKQGASIVLCRWKDDRAVDTGAANGPTGYFVADVDGVAARMTDRGAKIVIGPLDYAGMRIAVLADPDGHQIELLARKSAATD